MRALLWLSLRTQLRRPGRLAVSAAGIAFGVAIVVAVAWVNADVLHGEPAAVGRGAAQLVVRPLDPLGLPGAAVERVRSLEGVVAARPTAEAVTMAWSDDGLARVRVLGAGPDDDAAARAPIVLEGRRLDASDDRSLVLGRGLAAALGVRVGDEVELFAPEGVMPFVVVGVEEDRGSDALGASVALAPLRTVQSAFGRDDRVDGVDVVVRPGSETVARTALTAALADLAVVDGVDELHGAVGRASHGLRFMVALAAAMALVAAGCLVLANTLAGLEERRETIAALVGLGEPRGRLRSWLVLEALALGAVGTWGGLPLGAALGAWWVGTAPRAPWLPGPVGEPALGVGLGPLALGVVVGLAGAAAATVPVWRAAHARLGAGSVRAVRDRPSRWWLVALVGAATLAWLARSAGPGGDGTLSLVGAAISLASLAMAALAVPALAARIAERMAAGRDTPLWARLAGGHLCAHAWRSSAVAVGLTLSVAVAIGTFGTVGAFERTLEAWAGGDAGWHARVTVGRAALLPPPPLHDEAVAALGRVEGVEAVAAERLSHVRFGDGALTVHALDLAGARPARSLRAVAGPTERSVAELLAERPSVAVSVGLAARTGLGVDDVLTLATPGGAVGLRVAAVVADGGHVGRAVYMDRRVWSSTFGDDTVDTVWLALAPGATVDGVRASLAAELGERYRFEVVGLDAARRDAVDAVRDGFGMARVLVALAVFVALAGALNAGLTAAWSWRRDVALLRALGAAPGLVIRTLAAEAALVTTIAAAAGAAVGTVLTGILLDRVTMLGARVTVWTWPTEAYVGAALVAVLAALLAAVPTQSARRSPVAELLRLD